VIHRCTIRFWNSKHQSCEVADCCWLHLAQQVNTSTASLQARTVCVSSSCAQLLGCAVTQLLSSRLTLLQNCLLLCAGDQQSRRVWQHERCIYPNCSRCSCEVWEDQGPRCACPRWIWCRADVDISCCALEVTVVACC